MSPRQRMWSMLSFLSQSRTTFMASKFEWRSEMIATRWGSMSAPDHLHGEILVARVFFGLADERLADLPDQVVGRPAGRPHDGSQVDELVAEQAELELPVGGE